MGIISEPLQSPYRLYMQKSRISIFLILLLLLSACVISDSGFAPVDNTDFIVIKKLNELDWIYNSISDASFGRSGGKIWEGLGKFLWPNDRTLHINIARVEIRAQKNNKLLVKAFDYDGKERKQQVFIDGHDFDFSDGRIKFHRGNLMLQDHEDPLLGPDVKMFEIGLDQKRNGKVKINYSGTGLFMFIPVAIHQTTELRFKRVSN